MREIVSPLSGIRSPFGARRNPLAAYRAGGFTPKLVAAFADEFYAKEGRKSTFDGVLEPTATTNGTMVDSDGLLKWRPHNMLIDTVGLTTNWSVTYQGTGSLPTVTRDYAAAPDGTMTAARLQCSRASAGGVDRSYLQQVTIPTVIGSEVTHALWVKSTDGTPQTIQLWNQQEANSKITETVGSSWQRISLEYPVLISTAGKFWIGLVGAETTDLTTDVLIWHPHLYRSDLGGMASDPDQPTGFETYVPTTTSAAYLPRRGHHIYNGSAWVNEGILVEPSTQTNIPNGAYSSPKNGSTFVTGLTISDDAGVGFAGAGTGPRVTGSGSSGTQRMHLGVGDATYRSTAQVYIAKSSTHKYYQIINSNDVNAYVNFDINDGSLGNIGSAWSADGIVSVVEHETFYELIVNDTVASSVPRYLYFVDSKTASWAASSATSDYGDIPYVGNIHQSGADNTFPALPIICTGSQVARAGEQLVIPHENISWPEPVVIGDELVTNGTFATDTDWTKGTGWTISGGVASHAAGAQSGLVQSLPTTAGKVYQITFDYTHTAGSSTSVFFTGSTVGSFSSTGTYTITAVDSGVNDNLSFQSQADATVTIDNISVREIEPLALSIHMQGRMTYADTGVSTEIRFFRWLADGSNYIVADYATDGAFDRMKFEQSASGTVDNAQNTSAPYSPDINVPFNIASRHGSTFVNGAVDGVALTEDTTPVAIPDLETTDLQLAYSGGSMVIKLFRMWDQNITDAGTEDATEPSTEPSLSLIFDGSESSFTVLDWSA